MHTEVYELLQQGAWFGALPKALQALILERSVIRSFHKGEFLIREGAPPKAMYALIEGHVRATRQVGDGDEVLILVAEPGFWFGEYAVYSGNRSIGSLIADSQDRALMLTVQQFERIVADEPRYFRHFANLLLEHFAYLFRYVAEGHGLPPEDWLCIRLADMAAMQRHNRTLHGPVDVTVSQGDLATMIGVSRQTLNTLLARLQARGLIDVGFRRIRVLDEARLRNPCGSGARLATVDASGPPGRQADYPPRTPERPAT